MFCTNCGKNLEDTTKFCIYCGAPTHWQKQASLTPAPIEDKPVDPIKNTQEPKRAEPPVSVKKSKAKIWIISGICAAVIMIGGGVGYFAYQNHVKEQAVNVIAFLDEGEYDKAIDLFEKYSGKKKAFDDKVLEELLDRTKLVKNDYFNEKIDYASAIKELHRFEDYNMDELQDTTDEISRWISRINRSRENYREGKELFDQGDYAGAIVKYNAVEKEDTKYYNLAVKDIEWAQQEEARRLEEERINNLRNQVLSDAENYAYYNDYEAAVTAIEQGLEEIPEDRVLTDQLAHYKLLQEMTFRVTGITSSTYEYTYTDQENDIMTVAMEFPVLEGDNLIYEQINQVFESYYTQFIASNDQMAEDAKLYADEEYFYPYSFDMSYSVRYNNNGILCIMLEGYSYTGGAHGYPFRQTLTFDLASGNWLGLDDLIATDEATFGSYVTQGFQEIYDEYPEEYWEDAPLTVQNRTEYFYNMDYYLTEEGICIFFYPYDLASYARGFVEFTIPYEGNEWMFEFLQ